MIADSTFDRAEFETWLREEIARIEAGGEWPTWFTKEQAIAALERELSNG